jgi:tetratricopeptide (TPR) repeat protein
MRAVLLLLLAPSIGLAEPSPLAEVQLRTLDRLIAVTPDSSPEKADMLFRRASLALERAGAFGNGSLPEPQRNLWTLTGVKQLLELTERYPGYPRTDEVLFLLSRELLRVQKQDAALKYFKRLILEHPRSRFVGDALAAFGDFYFDRSELESAEKFFEKAILVARPELLDYARYKSAWCALGRHRDSAAVERLTPVARSAAEPLRSEARKDLLRAYARAGDPDKARALFESVDAGAADAMLDQLATEYRAAGRADACRALARGVGCD